MPWFWMSSLIIPCVYGTETEIKYVYSRNVQGLGAESLKLLAPRLFQKFPQFYGDRRSITVFTRAGHLSLLSQMNPVNAFTFYIFQVNFNIEVCLLLGFYATYNGSLLPTFRDKLSVPNSLVNP